GLLHEIVGAACAGLCGGEGQIEESHWHYLAEFRVGDSHEHPDRLLNLPQSGFLRGNLLWCNCRAQRFQIEDRLTDGHWRCPWRRNLYREGQSSNRGAPL